MHDEQKPIHVSETCESVGARSSSPPATSTPSGSQELPVRSSPPQPLSAEDGVDMEDTSFLYGPEPDMMDDSGDTEMSNALMDALQTVGVTPVNATRFVSAHERAKGHVHRNVWPRQHHALSEFQTYDHECC